MEDEERSQRLVHRIEAFSDLVMGFSLALLGLTLVIPGRAIVLVLHPMWIVAYFLTFSLIALLWMRHQRLFSAFFVAAPSSVIANFVFLSMLGLIVYFVQVFAHARGDVDQVIAVLGYSAAFAVALLTLGLMFAIGTRERWHQLSAQDRFTGIANAARGLIMGALMLVGCVATPLVFAQFGIYSTYTIFGAAAAGALASRMWVRYQKPRIVGTARAAT